MWDEVERRDSLDLGFRVWPVGLQQKEHGRCREVNGARIWAPQWGHLASREKEGPVPGLHCPALAVCIAI